MQNVKLIIASVLLVIIVIVTTCFFSYYPRQLMPLGQHIEVLTPDSNKYHNDCLHLCIRYNQHNDSYYMVQSPWYQGCDSIENPILYHSESY